MLGFDPRSFIIISAILGILCAFIFFVLRRSFPSDIQGLAHWAWGCVLSVGAAFLFALRDSIPVIFSSYLANLLVVSGIMLMYVSLLRFENLPTPIKRLLLTLAATGLLLIWPTFIDDDYRMRILLIGVLNGVLFSACALVIVRMQQKSFAERFTQAVFLLTAFISLTRAATAVLQGGHLYPATDLSMLQHVYLATFSFSLLALSMGFMLMVNRSLQLKLEYVAIHDSLTGLHRREAFFDSLHKEMARADRYHQPLSLLMIDLDNFKAINDQYGHSGGDEVIVDFSRKAQQVLRTHDLMGRYGGEEFIVALPNTRQDGALVIAERIRDQLAKDRSNALPAYTVSIGLATMQDGRRDPTVLLNKADQALYVAKRGGKNRIECVL